MKSFKKMLLAGMASFAFSAQAEIQNLHSQNIDIQIGSYDIQPLETKYYSYNFGTVWLNSLNYVRYTVKNTGDIPLEFKKASISGAGYDAYHTCSRGLQVGEKCSFEIQFRPYWEGMHSGRFVLSFSEDVNLVVDTYAHVRR